MEALLDRPVWNSLRTGWAPFALRSGERARRLDPDYGPFAAAASAGAADLAALSGLLPTASEVWLVERDQPAIPPGTVVIRQANLLQMVMTDLKPKTSPAAAVDLGDADAAEMLALAQLTKPGPFARLTHKLGGFVGVRDKGRLVAMAGERMRMPGYCEVSGVCTRPDHRGRGLAGLLMSVVAGRMLVRGEAPFLHSYAHNDGAIALYESLGFRARAMMEMAVIGR